jgi:hypothetical protein
MLPISHAAVPPLAVLKAHLTKDDYTLVKKNKEIEVRVLFEFDGDHCLPWLSDWIVVSKSTVIHKSIPGIYQQHQLAKFGNVKKRVADKGRGYKTPNPNA